MRGAASSGALVLAGCALVLTSCAAPAADGSVAATGESSPAAPPLQGWRLTSTSVSGWELVNGTTLVVSFFEEELSAHAGCNHVSGEYRLDGRILRVTDIGMTEAGCEPERHRQDEWVVQLLKGDPTLEQDGDRFVLRSADAATTVEFIGEPPHPPESDRPLIDTVWVAQRLTVGIGDDEALVSTRDVPDSIHWILGGDGRVEGFDGCNPFSGRHALDGDGRIVWADVSVTPAGECANVTFAGVMAGLLAAPVLWDIDGRSLTTASTANSEAGFLFAAQE